jgi:hypothetical protein
VCVAPVGNSCSANPDCYAYIVCGNGCNQPN